MLRALLIASVFVSAGASYRTTNFTVTAATREIAQQVGVTAERERQRLARQWLGRELPPWHRPCPIHVTVGRMGAGGWTKFSFDRGHVFNWNMKIQGSLERILDSVLPHEISHTIFACKFRRPLPRWADEGAATLCEHHTERQRQTDTLQRVIHEGRRIPLRVLLAMTEYPRQTDQVLTLYAEGYSLAEFLVQQAGRKKYLDFLDDAHRVGWEQAIRKNYAHKSIEDLERQWQGWFLAGSPRLDSNPDELIAETPSTELDDAYASADIRMQSPDEQSEKSPYASNGARVPRRSAANDVRAPAPARSQQQRFELGAEELSAYGRNRAGRLRGSQPRAIPLGHGLDSNTRPTTPTAMGSERAFHRNYEFQKVPVHPADAIRFLKERAPRAAPVLIRDCRHQEDFFGFGIPAMPVPRNAIDVGFRLISSP